MRACGKADLVVVNDMDGAAGAVATKRREGEGLSDHALAGKGRIAVKQDTDNFLAIDIAALFLLGADAANHDRIDDFQMRRIRRQAEMHRLAVEFPI